MADGNDVGATRSGSRPTPDPTTLTTDQLLREIATLKELLLSEIGAKAVSCDERFTKIGDRFSIVEQLRVEQKADTKAAVDAALTAQKEAVREQNLSNTEAIKKSDDSKAEAIGKLSELFTTTTNALDSKLVDLKERVVSIESVKQGGKESREGLYGLIGAVLAVVVLLGILAASGVFGSEPMPPPTVTVTTSSP